jgi:phosphoketolase
MRCATLTLQICGSKASGHPGGFASSAEAYAALVMLGHTNIVTEVGHHAPGFYSAMFLDGSLEAMGIRTMQQLRARFRERTACSVTCPAPSPACSPRPVRWARVSTSPWPAPCCIPGTLFPVTIGDGGLGEPYILSAFKHFTPPIPEVTNFLPVLIWNGYSQEHHSMVSLMDNDAMRPTGVRTASSG